MPLVLPENGILPDQTFQMMMVSGVHKMDNWMEILQVPTWGIQDGDIKTTIVVMAIALHISTTEQTLSVQILKTSCISDKIRPDQQNHL